MTMTMERKSRGKASQPIEVPSPAAGGKILEHLLVVSDPEGCTEIHIPATYFWDCVDCFGENRLEASFTFTPPYFVARFRVATAARLRAALNDWTVRNNSGRA